MATRMQQMTQDERDAVLAEIQELADRIAKVGNVIGPALGAAWCDKALALERKVFALKVAVEDEWYRKRQAG